MSEVGAMNVRDRLQKLQTDLRQRGVVDVKFCIAQDANMPLSDVANDTADFLDAIVQDRSKPMPNIGDSVRAK